MTYLVELAFDKFAYLTGIIGEIRGYEQFGQWCLLIFAFLSLIGGFRIYRMFFSFFTFVAITVGFCILLEPKMDWGSVAAYFSVIGTVAAALAYRWRKLGGYVVCMLIVGCIGYLASPSITAVIIFAAITAVLMYVVPFYTICFSTSLWGAWILWEMFPEFKSPLFAIIYFACGLGIQLFLNRRQTVFPKISPEKLSYWAEKRRKAA